MYVVKVLKRKDASSLVVGVVVAMLVLQFLTIVTQELAGRLALWQWHTTPENGPAFYTGGVGWRSTYLVPVAALLIQLVALELLVWIYVWVHAAFSKKR